VISKNSNLGANSNSATKRIAPDLFLVELLCMLSKLPSSVLVATEGERFLSADAFAHFAPQFGGIQQQGCSTGVHTACFGGVWFAEQGPGIWEILALSATAFGIPFLEWRRRTANKQLSCNTWLEW
jgi:hypothetical protein